MQITDVENFIQHESWNSDTETGKGIAISWMINKGETAPIPIEFGELSIFVSNDGQVVIDTESMGKEHFLKVMELLYDMAEVK